jgi:hypothetical protein
MMQKRLVLVVGALVWLSAIAQIILPAAGRAAAAIPSFAPASSHGGLVSVSGGRT